MTDEKRDAVVEAVCADLRARAQVGLRKYGVTLERTDIRLVTWLRNAYEEILDTANYLKRTILELEAEDIKACGGVEGHADTVGAAKGTVGKLRTFTDPDVSASEKSVRQ